MSTMHQCLLISTVISFVAYWSTTGQLSVNYQSAIGHLSVTHWYTVGPVSVDSRARVNHQPTDTDYPPLLGNSRKYPYPTTDGFHVLTLPCLWKFLNALPPMPSEFHNRESPLPFGISGVFFGGTFLTWQRLYERTNMNLCLPKAVI